MGSLITSEIREAINSCVLFWMATISEDGFPSVSPKEAVLCDAEGHLNIASIASPQTIRNIQANPKVCLSFVDIFTQKGYKITGIATIVERTAEGYVSGKKALSDSVRPTYNFASLIHIAPLKIDSILSPSYQLFPEITETEIIKSSLKTYRVKELQALI